MKKIRFNIQSVSKKSNKFIQKQDKHTRERIIEGIEKLTEFPPQADIKRLKSQKDENYYRLRVGSIRVIYTMDFEARKIFILTIDNRGDIY